MTKPRIFAACAGSLALALAAPLPVAAQAGDPAAATIDTLDAGLLAVMRAGAGAGLQGRIARISPLLDRSFDIPLMTRLSVGPAWNSFSPADQDATVKAFRALTIAQYAKNFDSWGGETFRLDPNVETRGADRLVKTTIAAPGGTPEALAYRLRQSGGQWKVIDIYYRNGISQLATKRSDFAAVVAKGGAPALIGHLNRLAANPS
jgi:phospholipid transport system substrate-binding protein